MTLRKSASYEAYSEKIASYAKENPKLMKAFMQFHHAGSSEGALSPKHKELIALGIGIRTQCEGCIVMHIQDAIAAGATHDEIVETIGVAIYMSGGPGVIYGSKAFEALEEYENELKRQAISN